MDTMIIREKLESLRRCVGRVESRKPESLEELTKTPDIQDIVVLNLTRAIQLSVDIGSHIISDTDTGAPATMGQVFIELEKLGAISSGTCKAMTRSVGFRNIAVHEYTNIRWEIVLSICEKSLDDFRQFASEINQFLQSGKME